ncbi:MAG: alpha/beta hydrolase [Bacteroidetes bacterium]|nr:alpha/beta hydrolase [Bacteroidota bacterium]
MKGTPEQGWSATMDSPDQGAKDLEVNTIQVNVDSLYLTSNKLKAGYRGRWNAGDQKIKGIWKQGGVEIPLDLIKTDKAPEVYRPQEPKPPFPYTAEEVTFKNQFGGIKLAGTLTLPNGHGPFPAVILVSGSGPQNRDEELLGHKPFLVIADFLTRKGFAVLRYDDRGTGSSQGTYASSTTLDFATDAKAAFDFLRSDSRIIPSKIGIIGHSEGGIIAPIVASQNLATAFIIMLAGPSLPGEEILCLQQELIARASGMPDKEINEKVRLNKKIFSIVIHEKDTATARKKITALLEKETLKPGEGSKDAAQAKATINLLVNQVLSPWVKAFLTLDPAMYLQVVRCPVLALYGEKDLQVPSKDNIKPMKKALAKAGNSDYEVLELEGLNHLFQNAKTGSPDEYSQISETISPKVLDILAAWLKLKTK